MGSISLTNADALQMPLADGSVHMICCSPPYWGLRDYGLGGWHGGSPECDHVKAEIRTGMGMAQLGEQYRGGGHKAGEVELIQHTDVCPDCGAVRGNPGLGLEPLHDCLGWATGAACGECYICRMRVFAAECWRVLRDDGTLWLNLGDSYASQGGPEPAQTKWQVSGASDTQAGGRSRTPPMNLKPKDLCGIPWRVAFALQADGWYLRSDIIWYKLNPMPESVTDRPTKAHEYVFLLSKRARYYWDQEAVREEAQNYVRPGGSAPYTAGGSTTNGIGSSSFHQMNPAGRNRRTVWPIATQPYSGAHFATWPEKLVEPMVLAGTSERGVCAVCGAPWERVVAKETPPTYRGKDIRWGNSGDGMRMMDKWNAKPTTTGHRPTCDCAQEGFYWCWDCDITAHIDELEQGCPNCGETMVPAPYPTIPATVLDPFAGSGTTGVVARRLGRRFVGLDLSLEYLRDQARPRLALDKLDAWENGAGIQDDSPVDFGLFAP